MRTSFGHVNLTRYQKQFAEGQQSFSDFVQMMKSTRTMGSFERRYGDPLHLTDLSTRSTNRKKRVATDSARIVDPSTVINLIRKIVDWPEVFCPAESQVSELVEVQPRHTMALFLDLHGESLRAEVDIDLPSDDTNKRPYQTGTWRLMRTDGRNKRVAIATVDIER